MKESQEIFLRVNSELAVELTIKAAKLLSLGKRNEAQILLEVASDMISPKKPNEKSYNSNK